VAKITVIKGFKDILPEEVPLWRYVEEQARRIFACYGFREIRIPIMEKTELFTRGIGEVTDIVEKEMYTFVDRGEESLTLRPEATASILRAVLEHNLYGANPLKLFTIGPMFRRERPQRGRFRQFHQIDVEVLGTEEAVSDAEVISLLVQLLKALGIENIGLELNSLGCEVCRPQFRAAIQAYLERKAATLCGDCKRRLQTNPLRVFDCKVDTCRELLQDAPVITDHLCADCRCHFTAVMDYLTLMDCTFTLNPRIVRGLDYYTRTAFEVTTGVLGAQNAVAGGGRYDGLSEELGGPHLPGIGFAIGCERLLALLPDDTVPCEPALDVFIVPLGPEALRTAVRLAHSLRQKNVRVEFGVGGKSLKAQLKQANRLGVPYTVILGEEELASGTAVLRHMETSSQEQIPLLDIDKIILNNLRSAKL